MSAFSYYLFVLYRREERIDTYEAFIPFFPISGYLEIV